MAKLPSPNEPLQLADGTILQPRSVEATIIAVPSASEAIRLVSNTRRKLAELPALPKQLNAYAAVLVYTASGLADAEIAVATGFTTQQIQQLRTQAAYRQLETNVIDAVQQEAAEDVKNILAQGTKKAAKKVVELAESDDIKVALAASKDLLDRTGHKAAERIDINARMQSIIQIEYVDKSDTGVTIDMETV